MEECIFCKGHERQPVFRIRTHSFPWELKSCVSCKAYLLSPLPTKKQLESAYCMQYYGQGKTKFNPLIEFVVNTFRRIRASRVIKGIPRDGKVLDIGCGSGAFLNYLHEKYNFGLFGLEIKGDIAERAIERNKGFKLYVGFFNEIDFKNQTFDVITMYHVFEHLLTPYEDIQKIKKILKPGGKLIISMPNIDSWQATMFKDKWFHLDVPRHLIFFTPNDFKRIMKFEKFLLNNERYISWEQNPFSYIQSCLNGLSSKHNLLYEFLKTNKKNKYSRSDLFEIGLHMLFTAITLPLFLIIDVLESVFNKSATVEYTFTYLPND
ncbi:class I SAM-dependent methyltransferase [Aquimarina sp. MMG016]|uniref:class I SAM-dependent methyltransferase n=1 Tax=Aquimarina sp. MMG016 TaxID=2822690 RepID=UPI001B3A5BAC|nr:class I SAM-dependent methyltransferase [Aquimarina sp. MMG016]MBQ4821772.1 class I SAM-dependent methyltransferase [Aquimarina sp. MMG016]